MQVWIDFRVPVEHGPALEAWLTSLKTAWDTVPSQAAGVAGAYVDWCSGSTLERLGLAHEGLPTATFPFQAAVTYDGPDDDTEDSDMTAYVWEPDTQRLTSDDVHGFTTYVRVTLNEAGELVLHPHDTKTAVAYMEAVRRIGLPLPKF